MESTIYFIAELSQFLQFNASVDVESEFSPFIWNRQKTLIFLDLYKKYRKQVGSLQIRNLKKLYEIIAAEMTNILKIKVLPSYCENRWKVLERSYKKFVDTNKKTGQGRRDFEFSEEMNDILGGKKNLNPILLLEANSVDTTPIEREDMDTHNVQIPVHTGGASVPST